MFRRNSQRLFGYEQTDQRLRASLVAHYIGGGSGSSWIDRSGYGNHGVMSGNTGWRLGRENLRNAVYWIAAGNGSLNLGTDLSIKPASAISASMWIYPFSNNAILGSVLLSAEKVAGASDAYQVYWTTGNVIRLAIDGSSVSTSQTIPLMEWTHLSFTFDGSTVKIYFNGVEVASGSLSATLTYSSAPVLLGSNANLSFLGYYYDGIMDDVRIYNRGLSAAEVALLASPSFKPVVAMNRRLAKLSSTVVTYTHRLSLLGVG